MTEIRIEKRKPIWPWILLVVIVLVVGFLYLYGSSETEAVDELNEMDTEEVTSVKPHVMSPHEDVEIS